MREILFLIMLSVITTWTFGQADAPKRASVFFEVGGSGGVGSLNYEKLFSEKKIAQFTWRAGLSFAPIDKNNGIGIIFPVMINMLIGKNSHKFEIGLGQGITLTTKGSFFALAIPTAGYRFQSESKKWYYRATYTPLVSYLVDFQIQQWAGISIGYTFNNRSK